MKKYTKNRTPRKTFLSLRAAADGYPARLHQCGAFDRVSPDVWNRCLTAPNASDAEEWRRRRVA